MKIKRAEINVAKKREFSAAGMGISASSDGQDTDVFV